MFFTKCVMSEGQDGAVTRYGHLLHLYNSLIPSFNGRIAACNMFPYTFHYLLSSWMVSDHIGLSFKDFDKQCVLIISKLPIE